MGKNATVIERPSDSGLAPGAQSPSAAELWGSLASGEDSDHLLTIDGQGVITWINRVAAGVTPEQVVGQNVLDLCPSDERLALQSWLTSAHQGEPVQPLVGSFPTAHGLRYYDCRCTPVRRAGKLMVLLVQARDVTSEHKDRQALVTSEQRFRAVLEHSPDAICLWDSTGVIRFANPATQGTLAEWDQGKSQLSARMQGSP